jgi:membrane protein DedA with SNARE-associated domain
MLEEFIKAIPVVLASAIKFVFGPLQGYALKLHPVTTAISTVIGMMMSVVAFTYFGNWLKERFFKNYFNPPLHPSNLRRRFMILLRKYGLAGIAFFTPIILTPIGGTLLAVGMGKPKEKILLFMLVSSMVWSLLFTFLVYSYSDEVLVFFKKVWPF